MTVSAVVLVRLFLSAVALAILLMSLVAWKRRGRAPQATILSLLMVSAAIYCFGYSGEVAQTSVSGALFWLHVEYCGIPWLPALWLLLARKHNGLSIRYVPLFTVPLITFVGQLSSPWHSLYYHSIQLVPRGPFWVVNAQRGPIAWINLAYLYGAVLYGAWIYVSKFHTSSRLFRMQSVMFVASSLPPLLGYIVYFCGRSPWGLDIAPLTFGLSTILSYLAVIKLECFDLVPMARSLVFNNMRDAALVTDLRHRLVDFNPAALELVPGLAKAKIGEDLPAVLKNTLSLREVLQNPDHSQEITLKTGDELQHFEIRAFPLCVEEQQSGWAILLANVTAKVRMVHQLRLDAETDELTGATNRRRFKAAMERESARSKRFQNRFSVILVDIDRFKMINDRFGHAAGDKVLYTVARRIDECLRGSDLLSRYGGDEFAIFLPQTEAESARQVAERILNAVDKGDVESDGQTLHITVSIGFTVYDAANGKNWRQLLEQADQALYQAKAEGRNCVASWEQVRRGRRTAPFPENKGLPPVSETPVPGTTIR